MKPRKKTPNAPPAALTYESVFSGAGFMAIAASPLQRAILRAAEGVPIGDVIDPEATLRHFGCEDVARRRPRRVVLVCGIRGGKSVMSVAAAITMALTADMRKLPKHEVARVAIIGPAVDAAEATFKQLTGFVENSALLRSMRVGEPTANGLTLKRHDGRRVEIVVVAAHRGGLSVRNRWLAGAVLEELASWGSEAMGSAVNAEDTLSAAETRLLPGGQVWCISSPFGPFGLLFQLFKKFFGGTGKTLVVHAPTRALNPTFPQEQIDDIRADDPDKAAREYDGQWVDADTAFLSTTTIDAAIRKAPLIRSGRALVAGMDPATRANSWTLAVAWAEAAPPDPGADGPLDEFGEERVRVVVAGVWQWTGSKKHPLSPRSVLTEIAAILKPYGVAQVHVDGWSFDALQDHARTAGVHLSQHTESRELPYQRLKNLLGDGLVELPPDPQLRTDLLGMRSKATASAVKVFLPKTADGRHCDHASSVSLAVHYAERLRASAPDPRAFETLPNKTKPDFFGGGSKPGRPSWALSEFAPSDDDDFPAPMGGRRHDYF